MRMKIEITLDEEGELALVFSPELHEASEARMAQEMLYFAHRAVEPVRVALEAAGDQDDE